MTDRPHCLDRSACAAITPGKHCRSCVMKALHSNKEVQARRIAAVTASARTPEQRKLRSKITKARYADPVARAATGEAIRCALLDPEKRERHRAAASASIKKYAHLAFTPEARARAKASLRARNLAWCPSQYWDLNRQLKRQGCTLGERKRMIADQAEKDGPQAEARRGRAIVDRIDKDMRAKAARQKAMAY